MVLIIICAFACGVKGLLRYLRLSGVRTAIAVAQNVKLLYGMINYCADNKKSPMTFAGLAAFIIGPSVAIEKILRITTYLFCFILRPS